MNKILETLLEEKEIKLKGSLYHLTQINFSYNSNHIEGSQLTEEQTQYIYLVQKDKFQLSKSYLPYNFLNLYNKIVYVLHL